MITSTKKSDSAADIQADMDALARLADLAKLAPVDAYRHDEAARAFARLHSGIAARAAAMQAKIAAKREAVELRRDAEGKPPA